MPVTMLDPGTALVVIDLQRGVVGMQTAHPVGPVVERAGTLAATFRRHRFEVILVAVGGRAPGRTERTRLPAAFPPDALDIVDGLDVQPSDHLVVKHSWGAFTGTGLADHLRSRAITQIVLAGISTSGGVETTARQAYELGLNVTLAVDAMTDASLDAHLNSVTRIFPRLGETGTTGEIVVLLDRAPA